MTTNVQLSNLVDFLLSLWDGGTVTADGALSPGLDLGADVQVQADIILSVTALDIASADETYTLRLMGSNDLFTSKVTLCSIELGRAALLGSNKTTGTYRIPFRNWLGTSNGLETLYQYIRLELDVGGTSPSLTGQAVIVPSVAA